MDIKKKQKIVKKWFVELQNRQIEHSTVIKLLMHFRTVVGSILCYWNEYTTEKTEVWMLVMLSIFL